MDNFHIINLSAYVSPQIKEQKNKGWVEYSDQEGEYSNNYFQYLIDRSVNSPTNGAIINGICRMIFGKGLSAKNIKNPEDWAKWRSILKDEDLKRVIYDRKTLGMGAFQVTREKGKVTAVTHFPMQTLRPEIANDEGEIENWYYHPDWVNKKPSDQPKKIPSFGFGGKNANEIYVVKRYVAGFHYFAPVEYKGALPYAVLEEEIGDFLINDVKNHFSGTKVVNFNNGVIPDEEKRREIASDVKRKLTGSTGQRVIVSFNSNAENQTTVEDIPLDNAPDHYQYLAEECVSKLLIGHNAISDLLGFNQNAGGFANNAEELKNKFIAFDNYTIKPYQEEILAALDEIAAENDMSFNMYFLSRNPAEFGVKQQLSLSEDERKDFTDDEGELMLENLEGETIDIEEWECVDIRECKEDNESVEEWAKRLIKPKEKFLSKLARVITQRPSKESKLDSSIYKVRYTYRQRYAPKDGNSRPFCKAMMNRTDRGVVYRREDIDQASKSGVNGAFAHSGGKYDLFRWKGGPNCGHFWQEELYRLKKKTDGTYYEDKSLASSERVNSIPADEYKPDPSDAVIADIAPKETPTKGYHPSTWAKRNLT